MLEGGGGDDDERQMQPLTCLPQEQLLLKQASNFAPAFQVSLWNH